MPRPKRDRHRRTSGLTLIELLVVLVILGLLAGLAVPQVLQYLDKAKVDVARVDVENLGATLDLFRLDMGRYPTQDEGLEALWQQPTDARNWHGPYVRKSDMLTDPWQNPYVYRFPGQHGPYDLYSLGSDNAEGGEGENQDIVSW